MYSAITGTGDGSTIPVVNLTWDYLAKSHVKGSVNGVEVGITWTGASQVTFDAAPANGSTWRIYRETPADPMVDFTNGAVLVESDLDLATRQPLYRQDEIDFIIADDTAQAAASAAAAAASAATAAATVTDAAAVAADRAAADASAASAAASAAALDANPKRIIWGPRNATDTIRQAREYFPNVHLDIKGFARFPTDGAAGITGGNGQTEYYVDKPYLDASIEGSIGWAIAKAKAGTGGFIYIDPRWNMDVLLLDDDTTFRFNAGDDNITIWAPGRNLTVWSTPLTGGTVLQNKNMIWRGVTFRTLAGPMSGNWDGVSGKVEHKLVSLDPAQIDRIAFDQCEFHHASDGALDMSSSTWTAADGISRHVTVQRSTFWATDEVMLIGSNNFDNTVNITTTADTRRLFVTLWRNGWLYTGQRQPKVLGRTFVHVVDSYLLGVPFRRDDPSPINEYGSLYGVHVNSGGWALVEGGLFTGPLGGAGQATTYSANAYNGETGAIKSVGVVAEDALTITPDLNAGLIPDVTTWYTLAPTAVPAAGPARDAWIASLLTDAGARPDAAPEGLFSWTTDTSAYPNGRTVLLKRGAVGRYIRVDKATEAPQRGIKMSGTYTPVADTLTNVASQTFREAAWSRDENGYVTVQGQFDMTTTASGDTQFRLSLPVPTTLADSTQAFGQVITYAASAITGGAIIGVASNSKVLFRPYSGSTSSKTYTYRFTYKVNI